MFILQISACDGPSEDGFGSEAQVAADNRIAVPSPQQARASTPGSAVDSLGFYPRAGDWYYVVLASIPAGQRSDSQFLKGSSTCLGFPVSITSTAQFDGMTPGYDAALLGAYSLEEARAVTTKVRGCVPDAYFKQARWLGGEAAR